MQNTKKIQFFIHRKKRKLRQLILLGRSVKRNRKRLKKAISGICEAVARVLLKK